MVEFYMVMIKYKKLEKCFYENKINGQQENDLEYHRRELYQIIFGIIQEHGYLHKRMFFLLN